MTHERHRRTDGRTDGQTTCDSKTALCTVVHRAVKGHMTQSKNATSVTNNAPNNKHARSQQCIQADIIKNEETYR